MSTALLISQELRSSLKGARSATWQNLGNGLALGYHWRTGPAGRWILRVRLSGKYKWITIGEADDGPLPANGSSVLTYQQALATVVRYRGGSSQASRPTFGYTVREMAQDYLAARRDPDSRAARNLASQLRYHIETDDLASEQCSDLTADRIEQWLIQVSQSPIPLGATRGGLRRFRPLKTDEDRRKRRCTANRALTYLAAALTWAFKRRRFELPKPPGYLDALPWRQVEKFTRAESQRQRHLSTDEVARLLRCAAPDFRSLVLVALLTGGRYADVRKLRISDFEADTRSLWISPGKGKKGRYIRLRGKEARFISDLAGHRHPGEYLLLRENGRPWGQHDQQRPMKRACALAGIEGATFHTLRHTSATDLLKGGARLEEVSRHLGHTSLRMTQRYAHLEQESVAELNREKAPEYLGIAEPESDSVH